MIHNPIQEADELYETYINGNIKDTISTIKKWCKTSNGIISFVYFIELISTIKEGNAELNLFVRRLESLIDK